MALMTRCMKCKKKIPMGTTYCDSCKPKRNEYKKHAKKLDVYEEEEGKLSARRWRQVRERVIIRDLGCCRMCLINGYSEMRNLQVHHLHKRNDRPDLRYDMDNLITLCEAHHKKLENLPYEKQIELLKLGESR